MSKPKSLKNAVAFVIPRSDWKTVVFHVRNKLGSPLCMHAVASRISRHRKYLAAETRFHNDLKSLGLMK